MRTPVLKTQRLILRPMTVVDAESAFKNWTSDPEVSRFMRWAQHKSVADTREWLESEEKVLDSETIYNWGFVLRETGELIGSGGLVFAEEKGLFELGYNIMRPLWGQGLATEAAQCIVDFARDVLGQKKLFCCHAKENPASGRVMQKVGFQYRSDGVYHSWDGSKTFEAKEYILETE